jgi:hypothetical protein
MKIFVRAQGYPEAPTLERYARARLLLCLAAESGVSTVYVAILREQRSGSQDAWACRIVARCKDLVVVSRAVSASPATSIDVACGRVAYGMTRPQASRLASSKAHAERRAS